MMIAASGDVTPVVRWVDTDVSEKLVGGSRFPVYKNTRDDTLEGGNLHRYRLKNLKSRFC